MKLRQTDANPLGIKSLIDGESVIGEINEETAEISPRILNLREKLELARFTLGHRLGLLRNHSVTLSQYLRANSKAVLEATRQSLPTEGQSQEDIGGFALTRDEMKTYADRGLLGPYDNELSGNQLAILKAYCRSQANTDHAYLLNEDVYNLAHSPQIIERVSSILGDKFDCVRSNVFVKEGDSRSKPTQWHIAMPSYFGSEDNAQSNDYVSVWVTLTRTAKENGCLKMIPGSFRIYPAGLLAKLSLGQLILDKSFDAFFRKKFIESIQGRTLSEDTGSAFDRHLADRTNGANMVQRALSYNDYLGSVIRERGLKAVSMEAEAGHFYMFSSENFHASLPNTSDATRISIAFRYARASLDMSRVRNSVTMLKMLPDSLQSRIKGQDGYRAPVIRVRGAEILEEEKGNKVYLDRSDLFGKG